MKRRNVTLVAGLIALIAVAATSWWAGTTVQSPDQAAARAAPPEPSAVTATVERRVLSATVITRADVLPAGSVDLVGPTTDTALGGPGVVTGVFVTRGDEVGAGARLVEVSGRPVFVFAGATPVYRAMRPGVSGPDIAQLQAGLNVTGCDAGDSAEFDEATKACVDQLYTNAGYQAERNSPTEAADLTAAQAAVVDAEDALAVAELSLWNAALPPPGSAVAAAESAVNDAQRALDAATAAGEDTGPAREALGVARASHAELTAAPDTALEQLAVEQQERAVDRARQALSEIEAAAGPVVLFGEIVFVAELPARIDAINATVGQSPSADTSNRPLVVVSSRDLRAHISIPQTDRGLVQDGTIVELLYEATGETIKGTVVSVGDELESSATSAIPSYPATVDAEFPADWSGLNLRATLTSARTEGEVLVVPLAAVTSSTNGQTRVQVHRDDATLVTVDVITGLVADGFVEVEPVGEARLDAGDRVVVG